MRNDDVVVADRTLDAGPELNRLFEPKGSARPLQFGRPEIKTAGWHPRSDGTSGLSGRRERMLANAVSGRGPRAPSFRTFSLPRRTSESEKS
jgi:hypothetical protein